MTPDYVRWVNAGLKAWANIANSVAKLHSVEAIRVGDETHIKIDGVHVATVTTEEIV